MNSPVPGHYELTAAVPNPFPDRRSGKVCCWEQWPKGLVVEVRENTPRWFLVVFPDGTAVAGNHDADDPRAKVGFDFIGRLTPLPRSLGATMRQVPHSPLRLLAMLLSQGVISLDHVEEAARQLDNVVLEDFDRQHRI